ncbi:DUF3718 domain-containing protein [Chitinimonas sp.]|uniref:DUF3718 domain-containing protein n=1 Tax=Chitinimonas sp. TaxID=1934313 RepID=UPI0035AE9C9C
MKLRASLCLLSLLIVGYAKADEDIQRLCEYTKVDDRSSLRRKLDDASIDLRHSYDDIRCGGENLLRYAALNGALESATFIISKVGKRSVNDAGKDGMNAVQWTEKKMDGADGATKTKMKAVLDLMKSKQ